MYESSSCDDDVPYSFFAFPDCYNESKSPECSPMDNTGTSNDPNNISADPLAYKVESCVAEADVNELIDSTYGDQAYFRFDSYLEEDCQTLDAIETYALDGDCHSLNVVNISTDEMLTESWRVFVNDNGSITTQVFFNGDCSGDVDLEEVHEKEELVSNECVNGTIASTTAKAGDSSSQASDDNDDNSGVSARIIAGIVVACVVAVGLV